MKQSKSSSFNLNKDSLEQVKHEKFFKDLDVESQTLRELADNMVAFLDSLKNKTPEIIFLKEAFQSVYNAPIEKMDEALDRLKEYYLTLKLNIEQKNKLSISEKDLHALITKQNHFNEAANKLVMTALVIYEAEHKH